MNFTVDWFSHHIPNWERWLAGLNRYPCHALEIGSFEGRSTVWLLQNILVHPQSHIVCIDNFDYRGDYDFSGAKSTFQRNTAPWAEKVTLLEGDSKVLLKALLASFDFAYVDGSHVADNVFQDGMLAWPLVRSGALMIFDDYTWQLGAVPAEWPAIGIDKFLETVKGTYDMVSKRSQVVIRKR